jgi:hypothetical protein
MRSSSQGGKTTSDGFGNSALANRVRSATQRTNQVLAGRGSNQSFDTNTGRGYNVDTNTNTINSESVAPSTPINLPIKDTPPDPLGAVLGNNAGLNLEGTGRTYDTKSNQFTDTPLTMGAKTGGITQQDILGYMGLNMPQQKNVSDDPEYRKALKAKESAARTVKGYTDNLNALITSSQQQKLNLENQGRGITTDILDTQSYEISRRTAVAALPVQAQIAAAQGDLESAQSHLESLYAMKSEELTNEYNYKVNLFNSISGLLTKAEERQYNEAKALETRTYNEYQSNADSQDEWARTALTNGHPELIASIHRIDPKSPTFKQQLAKIQGRMAPVSSDDGIPTIKTINGTDYQWEPITQSWIKPETPDGVSTTPGFENAKTMEETQMEFQNLDQAFDSIRAIAADYDKDVFQLDINDIRKFSNADMDVVGKSLAIIQNPQLEKVGGDAGNALEATGFSGKVKQFFRRNTPFVGGKKYTSEDVYDAVLQARKQYKQKVAKFGYAVTDTGELVPIIQ